MSKRNQGSNQKAPPQAPPPPTKKILFVSQKQFACASAEAIFETEATKSDLNWTAIARPFISDESNEVTLEDLQSADMVVMIEASGSTNALKENFPAFNNNVDVWKASPEQPDFADLVLQNVKSLIVRLIMQGGKRPALATPPPEVTPSSAPTGASKHAVRVSRESKGRGGKTVTVITGLQSLHPNALQELATKLKQACGTGGTVKDGNIEIQGDQRTKIMQELQKKGYQPKLSGG